MKVADLQQHFIDLAKLLHATDGKKSRIEKLRDGRLLGRFFATTRAQLRETAERLGIQRPVNVVGYPVG
jgi:hypothetical protein